MMMMMMVTMMTMMVMIYKERTKKERKTKTVPSHQKRRNKSTPWQLSRPKCAGVEMCHLEENGPRDLFNVYAAGLREKERGSFC